MKEEIKFKLGDRVYAPFHGYGVVTAIHEDACVYPIEVTWDDSGLKNMEDVSTFTADGLLSKYYANTDTILTVVKGSHKRNRRKEMSASKFKVGDKVFSFHFGFGVVENILDDKGNPYPVAVRWSDDSKCPNTLNYFSENGVYDVQDEAPELDIHPLNNVLDKKTEDAINPSHYKVNGLPEAHEIMKHLMNREQLEGFYWGNIVKYTYRYGRKGDKKETAGKIEWYAQKLKELKECESE